jgi:sugar lactone lactonase YvrE
LTNPFRLTFPEGTFPDGMAFDAEGALWIICVVSNRLIRVAPDLTWTVIRRHRARRVRDHCLGARQGTRKI